MKRLTPCEMELMDILWDAQSPMNCKEIQNSMNPYRSASRIDIVLSSILEKQIVSVDDSGGKSRVYARKFTPSMTREQYWAELMMSQKMKPDIEKLILELRKKENND